MCFNMSIVKNIEAIQDEFRAEFEQHPLLGKGDLDIYQASGFSHPQWPIIASDTPDSISMRRWGLIPHWIKDSASARDIRAKTLNARGETLRKLPSYRYSYPTKRCLVLVEGFFEPYKLGKTSYPFYIFRKGGKLLTLGGLYSDWTNPETGLTHRTFTIITVPALGITKTIHNIKNRMPLIIPEIDRANWLGKTVPSEDPDTMLIPWEPGDLTAYPVSRALYSRTDDAAAPAIRERFHYGIEEIDSLIAG